MHDVCCYPSTCSHADCHSKIINVWCFIADVAAPTARPSNHRLPAVRSVTLNLANKFSQCTFSVTEHYDLFSDLIILRQALWRRSYDVIRTDRTEPTDRQTDCCRKSSTLPHRPEINLYASYHAVHDESTIQSRWPLQIRPEQPTPSLQNCHAHSLKTTKTL